MNYQIATLRLAVALGSISLAAGHGVVTGIVAGGTYYTGYEPLSPVPNIASWSTPLNLEHGFVPSSNFTTPDIICHAGATPGQNSISVKSGESLTLQWSAPWVGGHHGPVMSYLANCNGSCSSLPDKTALKFFKIEDAGIIERTPFPAYYAADELRDHNSSWTVWIPPTLKSGNYVLRHEIIALHVAEDLGGAQAYPQCINLNVAGTGSDNPVGQSAETLYKETDPGILIDIWQFGNATYIIPGPAVWSGAVQHAQPAVNR
ncbi:uncharacterized protein BP5553_02549 [Venustampulla echinocandica]|uniref:Auxiliary Activity family 9 catalytic domain-containing protein n=1 Tax=Venustampulla echinocandica TaxID=2656787 RepID=A0A370TRQ1_9HELO|nr:uncharacterized protein BP5553_02549 [Venustampulla echinocandica]RDL38209.1 hypothetical protein BP5553_02549 [Venustampulla echinocandica]